MTYLKTDYTQTPITHFIEGIKSVLPQVQEWGTEYLEEYNVRFMDENWSITTNKRFGSITEEQLEEDFIEYDTEE